MLKQVYVAIASKPLSFTVWRVNARIVRP